MTADEKFAIAVNFLLSHEEGLREYGDDYGGISKFGISLRFYKTIHPKAWAEDIRDLTWEQAENIYREYWWNQYGYDRINSPYIGAKIMDMAVTAGGFDAHRIAQDVANRYGAFPLNLDGSLNEQTCQAINGCKEDKFIAAYEKSCVQFYNDLVGCNPSLEEDLNGWIARVQDKITS